MYITKYDCVFLKLGESIYVAMDLIPILLGSLPLAHNAQHSLVSNNGTWPDTVRYVVLCHWEILLYYTTILYMCMCIIILHCIYCAEGFCTLALVGTRSRTAFRSPAH